METDINKIIEKKWRSVKDSLPEDGQMIAACVDRMHTGCVGRYCENQEEKLPGLVHGPVKVLGFTWKDVTHWMSPPQPPKE